MRASTKINQEPLPCIYPGMNDDDALSTWRQLLYTYIKMQRRVEEMLLPYGLALSQFEGLAKVGMNPGVIQQDLVKYLLVTKGNVGALVDRLEEQGFLERQSDPADRRANRLYLTESGTKMIKEIFEKHRLLVQEMLSPLGSKQRETLRLLLKELEPQ